MKRKVFLLSCACLLYLQIGNLVSQLSLPTWVYRHAIMFLRNNIIPYMMLFVKIGHTPLDCFFGCG